VGELLPLLEPALHVVLHLAHRLLVQRHLKYRQDNRSCITHHYKQGFRSQWDLDSFGSVDSDPALHAVLHLAYHMTVHCYLKNKKQDHASRIIIARISDPPPPPPPPQEVEMASRPKTIPVPNYQNMSLPAFCVLPVYYGRWRLRALLGSVSNCIYE
jgi:hypothetical protein